MKESFQRIVTWAKEHPWLAALIVGAVILVGWFVYKRMSSTGSGQTTQGVPLGDVAGQGSTNGDVTVPPGALGSGGAGSAAPPVILPQPAAILGGGGGGSGFAPIGDSGFGYPLPSAVGGYDLGTPLAQDSASVAAAQSTQSPLARLASDIVGPPRGATLLQNVVAPQQLYMPANLPGAKASGNPTGKTAASNTVAKTPAQQVGKGAKFTGTYQGVTYVQGFPVGYGGYNQQGGFTYTIPKAGGGTFTQTISQAMINYGSRTPTLTQKQPTGYSVLHGG